MAELKSDGNGRDVKLPKFGTLDMKFPRSSLPSHEDMILEILARLDPKSLFRFRAVSKYWYQFLSQSSFAQLYVKNRPKITGFFYQTSKNYPEKLEYVPIWPHQENMPDPPSCLGYLESPAILVNTCNGLLHWSISYNKHFISNPLTNKSVLLPWPFYHIIFAFGIAFDPSVSEHFKVIVLLAVQSLNKIVSSTFSSEKMNWGRAIEALPGVQVQPYCRYKGVFFNGVLYWELRNNSLLAYNVNDNVSCLNELKFLKKLAKDSFFTEPGCLGESGGRIQYSRVLGTVLYVWEANQGPLANSTAWVQKHSVDLCSVRVKSPIVEPLGMHALAFLHGCQRILLGMKQKITVFSFQEEAMEEVCEARRNGEVTAFVQPSMFFPYVQSLALFNLPSQNP